MTVKNISVLGCGWLGLSLAIDLISEGITVKGTTTTKDKISVLKEHQIKPYLLTLGEENETIYSDFLLESEVVIINFPPKRIPNIIEVYPEQLKSILPYLALNQNVIFISSSSVYQNTNSTVFEDIEAIPEKESGQAVLAAEQLLQDELGNRLTSIRFSGLVGEGRQPGRFLANKKELKNGDGPVNVIHREDCIGLIKAVIKNNAWGHIINGCADKHPSRKEYYTLAAKKLGLVPPEFIPEDKSGYKIVSNAKSRKLLGYNYKYPDPLVLVM